MMITANIVTFADLYHVARSLHDLHYLLYSNMCANMKYTAAEIDEYVKTYIDIIARCDAKLSDTLMQLYKTNVALLKDVIVSLLNELTAKDEKIAKYKIY